MQLGLPHTVEAAYCWQAPAPLHTPVVPQVLAACCAHSVPGSSPSATLSQVPLAPTPPLAAVEQPLQMPVHALLQQTPSTQNVLTHSAASLHDAPRGLPVPQVPPEQTRPPVQCASSVQLVRQLEASRQVYGSQVDVVGAQDCAGLHA